jgi:hypothetical protein
MYQSTRPEGDTMAKPTIEQLREQVRAPVITAEDAGYDEARAVHNGMFDRRPQVVVSRASRYPCRG